MFHPTPQKDQQHFLSHAILLCFQALDDIEVAMNILKRSSSTENPVDTHYKGLDIDLDALDSSDADFKVRPLEFGKTF